MSSVSRLLTVIFVILFVESIGLGLYFGTLTQAFYSRFAVVFITNMAT